MSELREEILGAGINKKRIIGVILVAIILTSIFAFSVTFFGFLFGSTREYNSSNIDRETYEDALLIKPPFPFDEDWFQSLLDQYNITDLPPGVLDMLLEMLDGDIDNLDLGDFSDAQLAALFGALFAEVEVFRVFGYSSLNDMGDILWKYETFDEYNGSGWSSNAATDLYDFYSYGDYLADYSPDPELLTIKMPVPADSGLNHLTLPTLFPIPFVIDNSFSGSTLNAGSERLYKDEYNSTTIDLYFSADGDVNITFDMFGLYNNVTTPDELNSTAVEASWTPSYIQDKYLQLPPSIEVYKSNNNFFNNHLTTLEGLINVDDNAFDAANKIRIYLQTQFSFPSDADDYNPAPAGRDIIDWFCETEQGVWSDFASAFCAFSRAFGIASRFVDGFNSYGIEEVFDNDLVDTGFAIKYKNLYNWAEIYIPTDISGDGEWVQFDIFDSYGGGGNPIIGGNYNITVRANQTSYSRPDTATITATVSSDTAPLDGLTITFEDYTTGQPLGQDVTDSYGTASIQVNIDSSFTVGPHLIEASYDFLNPPGYNITEIAGDLSITLTDVDPGEVNISDAQSDIINVTGYVYDPLNGNRVEGPQLNIILLRQGTSTTISDVFDPDTIDATTNGIFSDFLTVNYDDDGFFEVRADFNGSWIINTPLGPQSYSVYSVTNSSSSRMELNITKEAELFFYIDGIPSNYNSTTGTGDATNSPIVSRTQTLNLTARVFSELSGPYPNRQVSFYDYSRGDVLLGSATTNVNGFASINYIVGDYCKAGPNLLYARLGTQDNYSYFILNDTITINIISGPSPPVINRSGAGITQFNIVGEIFDSTNNSLPISYSEITLTLLKGGINRSSYLDPIDPFQTDSSGYFDRTFGIQDNTPPGNYTLRLDFNGTIDLSSYDYSYQFNLPILNTSTFFINDLKIEAEASFLFWINEFPSDDANNPQITRNQSITLRSYIHQAGTPIADNEWVYFIDVTQDNLPIGAAQTSGGNATVIYNTNSTTTAGPHLIYALWNNRYNYSYFILDAPINVSLDLCPLPREINRTGAFGRNFIINGSLIDGENGNPVKYGEIDVIMKDGGSDVSYYLNLISGSLQLGTTGEIDLTYSVATDTPAKNYSLHVDFNGTFIYTNPNYFHYFDLWYMMNFSYRESGLYDLRVLDPENITIYFFINGTPTRSVYSDLNLPERFSGNEQVNFSVIVFQSGSFADGGSVYFTDVYTGSTFGTSDLINGFASNSTYITGWHGGLHRIEVQWDGGAAINSTYIIINKSVNFDVNINPSTIQRNDDNFVVLGTVHENGENLRYLGVSIRLLDNSQSVLPGFNLIGTQTDITDNTGNFQFNLQINITCLQGNYFIRIDFNGTISGPGIDLSDYMIHNNSTLIPINVTAGTSLITDTYWSDWESYDPLVWILGDTVHINGTLLWDNGTAIEGVTVIVSVRWASNGTWIASNTSVITGPGGIFEGILIVDWEADTRAETSVWVTYSPPVSEYIEGDEEQYS